MKLNEGFVIEAYEANPNGNYVRNITKDRKTGEAVATFTNDPTKVKVWKTERGAQNAMDRIDYLTEENGSKVVTIENTSVNVFKVITLPGENPQMVPTSVLKGSIENETDTTCTVFGSDEVFLKDEASANIVLELALNRVKGELEGRIEQINEALEGLSDEGDEDSPEGGDENQEDEGEGNETPNDEIEAEGDDLAPEGNGEISEDNDPELQDEDELV